MLRYFTLIHVEVYGVFHCWPTHWTFNIWYMYVCRVTHALGREASVYTLMALLESVRESFVSRDGCKPVCEEMTMTNNWHDYFKVPGVAEGNEPMSRQVCDISLNHQFRIKKNKAGHTVVMSKQFANSPGGWEAFGPTQPNGEREAIDGCRLLLKVTTYMIWNV